MKIFFLFGFIFLARALHDNQYSNGEEVTSWEGRPQKSSLFNNSFQEEMLKLEKEFNSHILKTHQMTLYNSLLIVMLLIGVVFMILMETLKKNSTHSMEDENLLEEEKDMESRWKELHTDVFRSPSQLMWFSALIGTGYRLTTLLFVAVLFFAVGSYYKKGIVLIAFLVPYGFASLVSGYKGASFYGRNRGKHWIKAMILTAGLPHVISLVFALFLNLVAIRYGSLEGIVFFKISASALILESIFFPLTLVATLLGRNSNRKIENPCMSTPVPKRIPENKWYLQPWVNIILSGILPFASIFLEMYFLFSSFWGYQYYDTDSYRFVLLEFIILVIEIICTAIISTFFLLNSGDYKWQWTSFLSAASISGYIFLYSIHYFFFRSKMYGFFQTCFYFGYVFIFCFGIGIICGVTGFTGASIFVRRIYKKAKIYCS